MSIRAALLGGAAALLMSANANAAANGWYLSLEGGASWLQDNKVLQTRNDGASTFPEQYNFDTGWAVLATVGFEWSQWRFEGEVGYRGNDIGKIAGVGPSGNNADFKQLSLMANMLYDIPLTDRLSLSLGAGIGFDRARLNLPGFFTNGFRDEEWNFAWQLIAGLNCEFSPGWDAFVDYRFLDAQGPTFEGLGNKFDFHDIESHAVTAGLRWHFN